MSLWEVPDKETSELMQVFYNYIFSSETPVVAYNKTIAKMKQKYPPYYWAGFVMLE